MVGEFLRLAESHFITIVNTQSDYLDIAINAFCQSARSKPPRSAIHYEEMISLQPYLRNLSALVWYGMHANANANKSCTPSPIAPNTREWILSAQRDCGKSDGRGRRARADRQQMWRRSRVRWM